MGVELVDLPRATFDTTHAADKLCNDLTKTLGWRHRYVAARLAIARSLSLSLPPPPLTPEERNDMATPLRGMQLFGEDVAQAAWLALITQRADDPNLSKQTFRALVAAHWKRGAELLQRDWEHSGCDMARFVARLAELANFRDEGGDDEGGVVVLPVVEGEVRLSVGEVAQDVRTGEHVEFALNTVGGSPHMAFMGGVGSGKTRTAVHMLRTLRSFGSIPLLAFDFKGDLAAGLSDMFTADVLCPPVDSIPLDILHLASADDNAVMTAAARIRDSIASVKSRRLSGIQSDTLREATMATLRMGTKGGGITLRNVANALEDEYERQGRKPDELTATLKELTQFDLFVPTAAPADFFGKSWIIQLPQDSSEEMRRLIINLTLNALDRWLNAQPDAPTDADGVRALRQVTFLDEAHVVLKTKLPALENLIRMSRSKGGVLLLASQSPDDFEGTDDSYLDNMGMTIAFNTQAKPGPTRRIFGDGHSLTSLNVGEALCRIRSETRTRRILAWK